MSQTGTSPVTGPYGTIGQRIGAYVLDGLFGGLAVLGGVLVALLLGALIGSTGAVEAGVIVFVVGYVFAGVGYGIFVWRMTAVKGYSPGKKLLGLRLVDANTLQPIGWLRVWLRGMVLNLIVTFTLGIGAIVIAVVANGHPRRQGWHDLAVGSVVVQAVATGDDTSGLPVADAVMDPRPSASAPPPPPMPAPPLVSSPPSHPAESLTQAPPSPPTPSSPLMPSPPAAAAPTPGPAVVPAPGPVPPPPGLVPPPPVSAVPPSTSEASVPVDAPGDLASDESYPDESTRAVRPQRAGWELRDSHGAREVSGPLLIRRDPDPALVEGAALWSIDDPERTVSKTHALVGVTGGQPFIEDWASTNGILLRRDGVETLLGAHERVALNSGDEILLGDYVIRLEGGA